MLTRSPPPSPPQTPPRPSKSPPSNPLPLQSPKPLGPTTSSCISSISIAAADGASRTSIPAPFVLKTYQMVDDRSTDDVVSWSEDGSSFIIRNPTSFVQDLLPFHFGLDNFSSFVGRLVTYGFRKVRHDPWEFNHASFRRGEKGLLCEVRMGMGRRVNKIKKSIKRGLEERSSTETRSSSTDSQSSVTGSSCPSLGAPAADIPSEARRNQHSPTFDPVTGSSSSSLRASAACILWEARRNRHSPSLVDAAQIIRYQHRKVTGSSYSSLGAPAADIPSEARRNQHIPMFDAAAEELELLYPEVIDPDETEISPYKFSNSKFSNRTPELSLVCNCEIFDLQYCLHSIDLSFVRHLTRLKRLILKGCLNLRRIPSMVKLKSLLWLDLSDCFNVKELPELPTNMKYLYLGGTAIEELPLSIIRLSTLLVLDLEHCTRLKKLPSGVCGLKSLKILNLSGCFSLPHQPPELLLEEMVRGFVKQECIRELGQISRLFSPWDISQVITKVWITRKVDDVLLHMAKLTKIHLDAAALTRIFHVSLLKTHVLFRVAASKPLPITFQVENFVELRLPHNNLQLLWTGSLGFVNVRVIDLRRSNLMTLPDFSEAQKLVSLNLRGCVNLLNVSSICNLPKLEHLDLRGCKSLTVLPSVADLKLLNTFRLSGCSNLKALPPSLGLLHSLNVLDLNGCSGVKELPKSISDLTSLQSLNVSGCGGLLNRLERSRTKAFPSPGRTHSSGNTYKSGTTPTIYRAFQSTEGAATYKQRICTSKKAKKEFAAKAVEIQDNVGKARDEEDNGKEAMKLEDRKRKRDTLKIERSVCENQKGKRSHSDLNEVIGLKSQSFLETQPSENNANGTSGDGMFFDTAKSSPTSPSQLASTPFLPALRGSPWTSLLDEDCDALDDPGPSMECAAEVGISSKEKAASEFEKENNMVMQQRSSNADRLEDVKGIPGIHNLNSKDMESLDSCIENDKNIQDDGKVNALKDEIDRLQEQLAALEKRWDDIYQCCDSLDSELKPLHAELQNLEDANLMEQKLKLEQDELEALSGWEDVKKMVAEVVVGL